MGWYFVAAVNGNKDVARILLKYEANVNAIDLDGKTPLMIAVVNGHQSLVEVLLSSGADLTVKNSVSLRHLRYSSCYFLSGLN